MAEFVEAGGRYVFDREQGVVRTVLVRTDSSGRVVEDVAYVATIQCFKYWCAQMRACEAEIDAHLRRENVVAMSDFRVHADTG